MFSHQEIQTVVIDGTGFSPAEISVHQGSTINFLNKDNTAHWPASDPHPTHEIYPEFDPKRPIAPGDVWGFSFEKTGTFRYHDHLNPHIQGVVKVEAEVAQQPTKNQGSVLEWVKSKLSELLSWFWRLGRKPVKVEQFRTLSEKDQYQYLEELTKKSGGAASWQFLNATYLAEAGELGRVHDLAHLVGGLIYKTSGWTGLATCTPKFAFGCYHGFLDRAFASDLSGLTQAEEACATVGARGSGPYASCVHGIGHGVASFFQTRDLTGALATCSKLPLVGQQFCSDGVFMEFGRNASTPPLCDTTSEQYAYSCGRNLPTALLSRLNKPESEAIGVCMSAPAAVRAGCIDAFGLWAAGKFSGDVENIYRFCQQLQDRDLVTSCVTKAAGEEVFAEMLNWREKSTALCGKLETGNKESCQNYVAGIVKDYRR